MQHYDSKNHARYQDNLSSNSIQVDRTLPKMSADSASSSVFVYRGGEVYNTIATGNTTAYWDTGTLSFDSANNITCSDVPVWNMNIIGFVKYSIVTFHM